MNLRPATNNDIYIRHWEVYGQGPKKPTPDGNVT